MIPDSEIVRLIMLCVKMGTVTKGMKWEDCAKGIPQGAVLSPILANLYLHSFDQFVLSRNLPYVRYADDFIILCHTKEEAEKICTEATDYLSNRLKATLNPPSITHINDGFEFLGISINKESYTISEQKRQLIYERINGISLNEGGMDHLSRKKWNGIRAYYGELLEDHELQKMDQALIDRIRFLIEKDWKIEFLSSEYRLRGKEIRAELIDIYLETKKADIADEDEQQNKAIIAKRKREYKKREIENSELIVSTPGVLVGCNNQSITGFLSTYFLPRKNISGHS